MRERRRPGLMGRLRRRLDAPGGEATARWAAAALGDQRRTGTRPGRAAAAKVAQAAAAASGPVRITLLGQLAMILALEYDATAEPADLDQAVRAAEAAVEALRATPVADTLTRCEALTVAGHLHGRRFQLRGEAAGIDLAVARYTEAIGLLDPADTGNHLTLAAAVAGAHLLRHQHDGDPAALDRAAQVARSAAARAAGELLTPPAALRLLQARILTARYHRDQDPAALAEASVLLDRVCAELPRYDREYAAAQALFADVLMLRHAERAEPGLLGRAVEAARTAAAAGAPRDGYGVDLARAILAQRPDPARLDEAAGALRTFLAATGPEWIDWPIAVGHLIETLRRTAELGPGEGDLAEAITWGRRALAVLDAGHPVRPLVAANLIAALVDRGDAEALGEARGLSGVAAGPVTGHPRRATAGFDPAYARVAAHLAAGDRESLERARGIVIGLVAAVPAGEDRPAVLTAAAVALTGQHGGDRAELIDLAVRYADEAVGLTPPGHPALATRKQALGNALRLRHVLRGDPPALAAALDHLRDARRMLAPTDPRRAPIGADLGRTLVLQAGPRLLGAAVRLFREGARSVTAPARLRVEAAAEWATFAALACDPDQAVEGYQAVLELLPLTVPFEPGRTAPTEAGTLAADAAAVLLDHGDPGGAVAALEQGRTLLLAAQLGQHPDVTLLGERHPRRLAELVAVRAGLDADLPAEPDVTTAGQRLRLAAQWDVALAGIRAEPGFERFLLPPDLTGWPAGTVAVLNVSRFRCDALLLGDGGIRVVPLTGLDADMAYVKAAAFAAAVRDAAALPDDRLAAERRIAAILAWLEQTVTGPVLAEVPASGRLWWMPTGPLAALPVHAAADGPVSSYAPTLRSLLDSRTGVAAPARGTTAVVVAPDVADAAVLPGAESEADVVAARFPGAVLAGYPGDEEALRLVATSSWLHLACHATPRGLLLGTVKLDPAEIAGARAADGRLAFLSAGGPAPGEESPALAGAFHAAGYRHVIATLWPGDGSDTVVRDFYRGLPAGPAEAAEGAARALHDAVTAARRRHPDRPSLWARYVHLGP
jgi:CHAT domain-containing protein